MSRRKIRAGSTSQTVPVFVQDTSSTTGAGLGSLVFNTSGLAAKYRREGQNTWTTITLATATVGTWATGGFVSDGGPVTGGYEVGVPNAVLAAGAKWAEVAIYGAANMLAVLLEFELDAVDYQDANGFGLVYLTADLPTMAAAYGGGTFDIRTVTENVSGDVVGNVGGNVDGSVLGGVTGNVGGKVLGGGSGTIGGVGAWALNDAGAAVAPAATALSSATWTNAKAAFLTGDVQTLTAGERTAIVAALLADVIKGSYTVLDVFKDVAALSGNVTNAGADYTIPATGWGSGNTKITVTDNGSGNRTVSRS